MERFTDKIYSCISFLGLLPKKMGQALLSFIKKFPPLLIKKISRFIRTTLSSRKLLIMRLAIFTAVIVAVVVASVVAVSNSYKVQAISLTYDGELIGYAATSDDAELAKSNARIFLGSEVTSEIICDEIRINACEISDTDSLCDTIVETLKEDLVEVNEVYIGNKLICAVDDPIEARKIINSALDRARALYPEQAVSFANSIDLKPTYYKPNDKVSTSADLEKKLADPSVLQIQHTQCLEAIAYTEFETVEIQSNELFVGDSRIKRTGQNGTEYQISLVKTVNEQEIFSKSLINIPVQDPVTQIVERGIRAENLVMDTYTVVQTLGVFCWPCVDLYEVTSPYGERTLNYHEGIDISGPNAEGCLVVAGAGGTVTEAGYSLGGYGNYVIIDHGNGIETLYGHMLDNSLRVSAGDRIEKGEVLGQVGNTGYSFGAHLHFEVRINGIKVNPAPYLGLQS